MLSYILSNYEFDTHLRNLFDVIFALGVEADNLLDFDLFIHHRAYRKLGCRVLEFFTHWGKSPFHILSENLDNTLESQRFEINGVDQEIIIQSLKIQPTMRTDLGVVYEIDGGNASQWLAKIEQFWLQLHKILLYSKNEKLLVKKESPLPSMVEEIVSIMMILKALVPIFKHISSPSSVAQALAKAGELRMLFNFIIPNIPFFVENNHYQSRNTKSSGGQQRGDDDYETESELQLNDCESWPSGTVSMC